MNGPSALFGFVSLEIDIFDGYFFQWFTCEVHSCSIFLGYVVLETRILNGYVLATENKDTGSLVFTCVIGRNDIIKIEIITIFYVYTCSFGFGIVFGDFKI